MNHDLELKGHPETKRGFAGAFFNDDNHVIGLLLLGWTCVALLFGTVFNGLLTAHSLGGPWWEAQHMLRAVAYQRLVLAFFVLVPAVPSILGHLMLPRRLGVANMALPTLSHGSLVTYVVGLVLVGGSLLPSADISGWTMSVTPVPAATLSLGLLGLGLSFAMLSWLLTGLNIVFTVHLRRRAGMHFGDMPVLVWTLYLSGIQLILAAIGISIALLILAMFYTTGDAFFGPGSDPWRKLFAFLSSLVLLPAVGVMTDVISGLSRKDISAPRVVLGSLISLLSLAVITGGMMLFGHSRETGAVLIFTIIRLMAVIPLALITYSWLSTLHRGAVANTAATTWMLIFCLQAGLTGVMGLVLANPVLGVQLGGSMFASVQHDFLIWGVVVGGLMAGLHLWWPQVTGAEPGSTMARRSACLYVIGLNLALIPRLSPELAGAGQDLMFINAALTIPGIVSAVGWAMTLIALAISFGNLFAAKRSGPMSGSVTT